MPPCNRTLALALLFLAAGTTARADLTADDVWQSWRDGAAAAGLTVAADSAARDGAALRLAGVSVLRAGGPQVNIAEIVLTEGADGSVSAAFPDAVAMILSPENGTAGFSLAQQGMTLILREGQATGGMVYDLSADRLEGTFTAKDGDRAQGDEFIVNFGLGIHGFTLKAETTPGEKTRTRAEIVATSLDYDLTMASQILGSNSAQTSRSADVTIGLDLSVPATAPLLAMRGPDDLARALQDGMAARLDFEQGVTVQTDATKDRVMEYDIRISTQPGMSVATLDRTGMSIEGSVSGGTVGGTVGGLPEGGFDASFGAFDLLFRMPLIANSGPDPFALRMSWADIALGDAVWDLFDAGRVFPRDAASFEIDVAGKARLDLLGLVADDLAGTGPDPARTPEILSLDLHSIALSLAGAAVAGQGAFTFATAPGGAPVPDGRMTIDLTGANALLDGAVAAGLASADDVGGARMMLGMFMRPGAGDDSLTSEIEARPDGSIHVNGMKMR
ncbi:MAG: hypothetical protein KF887_07695 [Paracoccaceae bacterium]|nr:MAG: hypothetical protein KF887_07695 [Paracoccaceae bacterium]